ncbi:MAG: hypothetical protein KDC44_18765, partial [Phaeodactylibacter sp.]|nr:hypothetical protein [Phaeodactylibacter sp.]
MSKHGHLHLLKSGLLTLIQDRGRSGFQHLGVPPGGVMDRFSAEVANQLVGNAADSPVLEITMLGPQIRFENLLQIESAGQ